MPSKTAKQKNFMALCASEAGRKRAMKRCPPKRVAKEFVRADKRKTASKRKR